MFSVIGWKTSISVSDKRSRKILPNGIATKIQNHAFLLSTEYYVVISRIHEFKVM